MESENEDRDCDFTAIGNHKRYEDAFEESFLSFLDIARLAVYRAKGVSPCTGPDADIGDLLKHIEQVIKTHGG